DTGSATELQETFARPGSPRSAGEGPPPCGDSSVRLGGPDLARPIAVDPDRYQQRHRLMQGGPQPPTPTLAQRQYAAGRDRKEIRAENQAACGLKANLGPSLEAGEIEVSGDRARKLPPPRIADPRCAATQKCSLIRTRRARRDRCHRRRGSA